MQIYHTGSSGEAIVLNKEGNLSLVNQSHGDDIVFKTEDSSGNVVTPLSLDSDGAATFAKNLTVSDGSLLVNKSDGAYISLNHNNSLKGYLGIANQVIAGGSTGDLGLTATSNLVFGSGGTTERMRIDSDGNVGIGTTSPDEQLTIAGPQSGDAKLTLWADAGDDSSDGIRFKKANASGFNIETSKTAGLSGTPGWEPRFTILNSGDVGIGTTSPEVSLNIKDDASTLLRLDRATNAVLDTQNKIDFRLQNSAGSMNSGGILGIGAEGTWGTTGGLRQGYMFFSPVKNGSTVERMRIDSDGNVGIGTDSPSSTLDVNGDATFAGDIECSTASDGVILASPDGTRYKITVANDGTIVSTAV
jgi:hypothetical protein